MVQQPAGVARSILAAALILVLLPVPGAQAQTGLVLNATITVNSLSASFTQFQCNLMNNYMKQLITADNNASPQMLMGIGCTTSVVTSGNLTLSYIAVTAQFSGSNSASPAALAALYNRTGSLAQWQNVLAVVSAGCNAEATYSDFFSAGATRAWLACAKSPPFSTVLLPGVGCQYVINTPCNPPPPAQPPPSPPPPPVPAVPCSVSISIFKSGGLPYNPNNVYALLNFINQYITLAGPGSGLGMSTPFTAIDDGIASGNAQIAGVTVNQTSLAILNSLMQTNTLVTGQIVSYFQMGCYDGVRMTSGTCPPPTGSLWGFYGQYNPNLFPACIPSPPPPPRPPPPPFPPPPPLPPPPPPPPGPNSPSPPSPPPPPLPPSPFPYPPPPAPVVPVTFILTLTFPSVAVAKTYNNSNGCGATTLQLVQLLVSGGGSASLASITCKVLPGGLGSITIAATNPTPTIAAFSNVVISDSGLVALQTSGQLPCGTGITAVYSLTGPLIPLPSVSCEAGGVGASLCCLPPGVPRAAFSPPPSAKKSPPPSAAKAQPPPKAGGGGGGVKSPPPRKSPPMKKSPPPKQAAPPPYSSYYGNY